jgi:hypothetical protein
LFYAGLFLQDFGTEEKCEKDAEALVDLNVFVVLDQGDDF